MAHSDIEQVIIRARRGDEQAISALYEMHADAIYRYVLYRMPTAEDAEDLTAEVFLKMIEGLPRYQITGVPFEAWLYRIAAARIADFYRRRKRRPQVTLPDSLADHIALPEDQIQRDQEIETLRGILAQFNADEQTILILRFVERKSHQEVASLLGKSANAVKAAQHRALIRLAALLGSEEKVRHYLRGDND
jgi:RNA polymerase sigma-70 factor (ECF subfamily)